MTDDELAEQEDQPVPFRMTKSDAEKILDEAREAKLEGRERLKVAFKIPPEATIEEVRKQFPSL